MQAMFSWLWRLVPGNPQVVRIVQGASRRNAHAVARLAYVLSLILIVLVGLVAGGGLSGSRDLGDLAQAGAQVFRFVAIGQVVLVCLIAPIFMAGAIASEQSGKTYAILLTTPLSNLQIVLGSLVGRLFFILALLFSGLPLFAIMLIFGGVPVLSIFVCFTVAALTALFVGSIAVLLSVMRAAGRKAVFGFVISVVAYLILVGALDIIVLRNLGNGGETTVLTAAHPLLVLESNINRANYSPPGPEQLVGYPAAARFYLGQPFAAFATLSAGGSLLIVLFCSLWVRRLGTGDGRLMLWLKAKLRFAGANRKPARSLGTGNPIAWREAHTRGGVIGAVFARYGFVVLGLGGLGVLLYAYHFDPSWQPAVGPQGQPTSSISVKQPNTAGSAPYWFRQALTALLITEVAVIALVAMYMSAGCVSKEREDGTLDIMLTTPITPKQYVWGKLRGLVRFLAVMAALPVVTLGVLSLYTMIGRAQGWPQTTILHHVTNANPAPGSLGGQSTPIPLMYPEAAPVMLVMLVPFIAMCIATGMYCSLRAKGVLSAITASIAVIGGGALVLGFCGLTASSKIPLVGPIVNAFSPTTNVFMLVDPHTWVENYEEPVMGRGSLIFAALAAAGVYGMLVWTLINMMLSGFDTTVRKLSGTK